MLHTTEDAVRDRFSHAINSLNAVERVKKIRDYASVHLHECLKAMEALKQVNGIIWLYNYYFTISDNVNNSSFISSNESYVKTLNYSIQFANSCNPGLIIKNTNYISNNDSSIYSSNVYPSTSINYVTQGGRDLPLDDQYSSACVNEQFPNTGIRIHQLLERIKPDSTNTSIW
ncbi:APOBEC1 complementation factor [Schistosoma japonicum]|nr:APOBEC1 complementation factor [Schistosoma japonicum]